MHPSVPLAAIIHCRKAPAGLARTLAAVMAAKPRPAQVIVLLNGPDAKSRRIAQSHRGVHVQELPQPTSAGGARNRGLEIALTPFIMFLEAGDSLSPGLMHQLCASAEASGADLVFAPHVTERADGSMRLHCDPPPTNPAQLLRFWLSGRSVPACSMLWRASFLRRIGGWEEGLPSIADEDAIQRALYQGAKLGWARAGYGIHVKQEPAVPANTGNAADRLTSRFRLLQRLEQLNEANGLLRNRDVGREWIKLASLLQAQGLHEASDSALARARALGQRQNPVAYVHRCLLRGGRFLKQLTARWRGGHKAPSRGPRTPASPCATRNQTGP